MATWDHLAACTAPTVDPDLFFPDPGDLIAATEAKQICQACPVRELCLAEALAIEGNTGATGRYGIRGGLTPAERYTLSTGRRARRGRAECGSDAGYRRHIKNGEAACPACQEAHREYGAAWYRQTKARAAQAEAVA